MQKLHLGYAKTRACWFINCAISGRQTIKYPHKFSIRKTIMAFFDTTRSSIAPTGLANGIGSLFVSAFGTASHWNDVRRTQRALSQLSDRELEDIGLTRADIAKVARRR